MTLKWLFPEWTIFICNVLNCACAHKTNLLFFHGWTWFLCFPWENLFSWLSSLHVMSPVLLHVNEAPAHLVRPTIPLYSILTGSEKQMNTSFKVLLRRHGYYHYYIRFSKHNALWSIHYDTQYDWLLFSTVIKWPLSVITAVQIWTGYEHVAHG